MNIDSIIFNLSVIIVVAASLGTLFLYARQPIILAYIVGGFLCGPNGLGLITNIDYIQETAHFGVILLLFLIGLNMQPLKLMHLFRKMAVLTFGTALIFGVTGLLLGLLIGFNLYSALIFGAAMMFSSTVIGLKLIPTTALHHKRTGEIMTSVLLLQDVLAILVILLVSGEQSANMWMTFGLLALKFMVLCLAAFAGMRLVMVPLLNKFDVVQEYSFVATLGWCLLWAEVAHWFGLSHEMGAFVAGLSIASCKVALAIAEHLKPLREFFLILFFFAVGARLDLRLDVPLLAAAVVIGSLLVPLKATVFRFALRKSGESDASAGELGVRLGQASEFSLLLVFAALGVGHLDSKSGMVIQITTIVSFIVSTYWVVMKYPTPISSSPRLRKD